MKKREGSKLIFAGIRAAAFLMLFAVLLDAGSAVFMPAHGKREDSTIYYFSYGHRGEPRNSLDLVAVGNSDLYRGLSPMELWNNYGIVSCNSGQGSQTTEQAYRLLKDVFRYQSPGVVVLEVDSVYDTYLKRKKKAQWSQPVAKQARKLYRGIKSGTLNDDIGSQLSHRFPIVKKHAGWTKLKREDFMDIRHGYHFIAKGFILDAKTKPYPRGFDYMKPTDEIKAIDPGVEDYLNKILRLCRRKGARLVLLEMPSAKSWSYAKHNGIEGFAQKHGLPFYDLNLNPEVFGFDWKTDTKDRGDHLNTFGAQKASAYLGGIFRDTYGLPDRRQDPSYRHWYDDAKLYNQKKEDEIRRQKARSQRASPAPGTLSERQK